MTDTLTPDLAAEETGLITRSFQLRAKTVTGRSFTGLAVPYETGIDLWPGVREIVARDAVESFDPLLCWRHSDPIGRIDAGRHTEPGWEIDATISETTLGRDAITLLADGVELKLSIGFESIDPTSHRDDDTDVVTVTHHKIMVREVSIVPVPAYPTARITETRSKGNPPMPEETQNPAGVDLADVREEIANLQRSFASLEIREPAPLDTRSAGALVVAAVKGDTSAREMLERAYTGGTSADDYGKAAWAGDLAKIIDEADPLAGVFAVGALPESGMSLEYGRIKANTVKVEKQAAEGDALPTGNVSVETATTPVETYGGAAPMSVQEIKRSQAPLVDLHFRALAVSAGRQRAARMLAALNAKVTANASAAVTITGGATDWRPWVEGIVNGLDAMRPLGLGLTGMLLPKADWIALGTLDDADGRPMMSVEGPGANNVGQINLTTLDGRFLQLPTRLIPGLSKPVFYNRAAFRFYTSPLARVTNDLNALDLTQAIGVYQFGAVADEIPGAIVPVTIAAGA